MNVDALIDQILDILEEGKHSVFGGSYVKVDADRIRTILEDIRINMPDEVIQARKIAAERKEILSKASDSADFKIKQAEIQANKMIEESEITKQAHIKAQEIVGDAKKQAAEIIEKAKASSNEIVENAKKWVGDFRESARVYVETIMNESDEILEKSIADFTKSLNKVRIASQQLENAMAKKNG